MMDLNDSHMDAFIKTRELRDNIIPMLPQGWGFVIFLVNDQGEGAASSHLNEKESKFTIAMLTDFVAEHKGKNFKKWISNQKG